MVASTQMAELQEKRNQLAAQVGEYRQYLQDDGNWDSSERQEGWDKLNADLNEIETQMSAARAQIEQGEKNRQAVLARIDDVNQQQESFVPVQGEIVPRLQTRDRFAQPERSYDFNLALQGWWRMQMGKHVNEHQRAAVQQFAINPQQDAMELRGLGSDHMLEIQRARREGRPIPPAPQNAPISTSPAPDGGATISAETFVQAIEVTMLYYGPMRQTSEFIQTGSGNKWVHPTFDDTANKGQNVAEGGNLDNSGTGGPNPNFGQFTLDAYKKSSDTLLVNYELLEDNEVNLQSVLTAALGERLGRGTNADYTVGTGTGEATGIVTATTALTNGTTTVALDWDALIDLEHAVDIAYRRMEGNGFMMHDKTIAAVRKLKDSEGRPIWSVGINAMSPSLISGYPVYPNNDMPEIGTGNLYAIFGGLRMYKIRRAGTMRFYHLQELYRADDQDGFVALIREDGNLMVTGATNPVHGLVGP